MVNLLYLAALFLAFSSSPASADLIFTPLFAFMLTASGISAGAIAFGTTTWVSLLSGIASIAFGYGMMILMTPKPPKPESGHVPVQQSVPYRIYGYGRARITGAVMLAEEKSWLYRIHALAGHRCLGIVQFYLNNDKVDIDGDNEVVSAPENRYVYNNSVKLEHRLGNIPETPYAEAVANIGDIWDSSCRGDGITSIYMRCKAVGAKSIMKVFPYGAPVPSAVLDLAPVYDPRDPAQSWNNPNSWGYSGYTNPALILLHHECFSPFGSRRNFTKAVLPVIDTWRAQADICDDQVAKKGGGTEPRYACNGWATTEQNDPRSTRMAILMSCDGWMVERGDGTIVLQVGFFQEPIAEITDDDIAGYSWQSGPPNRERFEFLSAKYVSPACEYVSVETNPIRLDNGARALDQGRTNQLDLAWVQSTGQASRLIFREGSRYHEPCRGVLDLRLSAINALYSRWVRVRSSVPRLDNVIIENRRPSLALLKGRCQIEFVRTGSYIESYDCNVNESPPPTIPVKVVKVGTSEPQNVTAVAELLNAGAGYTITIPTTFDTPRLNNKERVDLFYRIKWKIVGAEDWNVKEVNDAVSKAGRITIYTDPVAENDTYTVVLTSDVAGGYESPSSTPVTVSTATNSLAPSRPANSTAVGSLGEATIEFDAPISLNLAGCRVSRSLVNDPFGLAVDASGLIVCTPGQHKSFVDTIAAGSYWYWAQSETALGVKSTPVGPLSATVS